MVRIAIYLLRHTVRRVTLLRRHRRKQSPSLVVVWSQADRPVVGDMKYGERGPAGSGQRVAAGNSAHSGLCAQQAAGGGATENPAR